MTVAANETAEHHGACERVAARFRSRWLRSYVGSKLRSDPAFPTAYELLRDSPHPILDVGCGVGLLGFYLRERDLRQPIRGLDRDARKIGRAKEVADGYRGLEFLDRDVADGQFEFSGNVALLDVLHYLAPTDQEKVLNRLAECVAPGGMLFVRDALHDRTARYWLTFIAERFAQVIRWNVTTPLHFPTRESVSGAFSDDQFTSDARPLWGRTPFNNYLLVFRRDAMAATAAVPG